MVDVTPGTVKPHRKQVIAYRDALVQLPKFVPRQKGKQFRLSGKYDLNQLVGLGLQVRDEPKLFQHLGGKVLRLVHDEDDAPPGRFLLQEETVQLLQKLHPAAVFPGKAKLPVDAGQELQ